jgi:VanZ family protein
MRKYPDISLTLGVIVVVSLAMLWPINHPLPAPNGTDKFVHLAAFAALAYPLARTGRVSLITIFISASAFGGIIEVMQPTFYRSADMNDWIADIIGVVIGIGCGLLYRRMRNH